MGAGVDLISALTVAPDGRIVAAGTAQSGSGNSTFAVARYLPDGSLDPSFGNHGTVVTAFTGTAEAVAVQSDGKIVVAGGHVLLPALQVEYGLARFDVNGDLDGSFGNGGTLTTSFPTGSPSPRRSSSTGRAASSSRAPPANRVRPRSRSRATSAVASWIRRSVPAGWSRPRWAMERRSPARSRSSPTGGSWRLGAAPPVASRSLVTS